MSFTKHSSLDPHGAQILRKEILTASQTTTVMDSIKFASGYAALNTAGVATLGHVNAIVKFDGSAMTTSGATGADIGSYVGTFLTASTNATVAKISALIDVSQMTLYSAEVDVAIGTTTGSDLAGYRMDLEDEDTLDESSAATTAAQYATWGLDPINSARAVVNILESSVFNFS